jgi:phosphoserine phosphatase
MKPMPMKPMSLFRTLAAALALALGLAAPAARGADALPSWNDGAAKARIVSFVQEVTDPRSRSYVAPAERIAVFDNDGTLWSEQPAYFQLAFAIDRVKALAPQHPEWKDRQPFKGVLEGDLKAVAATGERGLMELVMATHAGSTTDEFAASVRQWVKTARHPTLKRPYTELVFRPMLELLAYLRANGFKTYIVSGGGIEFMRVFAEEVYGVPPEQVIGSTIATKYELRDGKPVIVREPKLDFIDDKAGKPLAINKFIGRRPIAAFGNSDGDFEMLEWTTAGAGPRLAAIVHHDDASREFAYDRDSHIGKLQRGLDEGPRRGWTIVSMKNDWKAVYPDPKR